MKCYGYAKSKNDTLLEMRELTLQADSESLKRLANFLFQCAEKFEVDPKWQHEHFSDSEYYSNTRGGQDFDLIVFRKDE